MLWELPEWVDDLDASKRCRQVLLRAVARKLPERWATVEHFCDALRDAISPPDLVTPLSAERREVVHEKDGSLLVQVPGGEFVLGDGESRHRVKLSPYWIGKFPVTNEQYGLFLAANPENTKPGWWENERFNQPKQPVVGVSWLDAKAYCDWPGLALPTLAQWEAAARGQDERPYPWGETNPTREHADFGKDWETGKPDKVGSHSRGKGPYGTEDQAGCVWEWCIDSARGRPNHDGHTDPVVRPRDESDPIANRLLCGGAWTVFAQHLRTTFQQQAWASNQSWDYGFRVCRFGPGP